MWGDVFGIYNFRIKGKRPTTVGENPKIGKERGTVFGKNPRICG